MSIRLKIALMSAALLAILVSGLGGILWAVVRPGFQDIERTRASDHMTALLGAVTGDIDSLATFVLSFSSWDDTYAFVVDDDPAYVESNFAVEGAKNVAVHLAMVLDPTGRTVFSTLWSDDFTQSLPPPDAATGGLAADHRLMAAFSRPEGVSGLLQTPQGPLVVAARQILPSSGQGQPRGVVVFGRWLTHTLRDHLPITALAPPRLWLAPASGDAPESVRRLLAAGGPDVVIDGIGEASPFVTASARLADLDGAPLAVLTTALAKTAEPQGEAIVHLAMVIAALGSLGVVAVGLLSNHLMIVSPLRRLESHITTLSRTGDLDTHLVLDRQDEIGLLARAFATMQGRIRHLAHYDPLTGLPNRTLFTILGEGALARRRADGDGRARRVGVAILDIDRLTTLTIGLGRSGGERALVAVGRRLATLAGPADVVARGGDGRFLVLLGDLAPAQAGSIAEREAAERLASAFATPFSPDDLAGAPLFLTASIGLALFPQDGETLETLVTHAEVAVHRAKLLGRNNFQFFDGTLNRQAREVLALESALREALAENSLSLCFQPRIDAKNGLAVGLKALARWNHPSRGLIAVEEVLPLIKQAGLLAEIDRWMIDAACRQIRQWRDQGVSFPPIAIALSARPLPSAAQGLVQIAEAVEANGVNPSDLDVEIPESAIRGQPSASRAAQDRPAEESSAPDGLAGLGLGLIINDPGTDIVLPATLRPGRLTRLTIGAALVAKLPDYRENRALVRALIALADELDLDLLAEGVERGDQADWLLAAGCSLQQGLFHARPQDQTVILRWLGQTPWRLVYPPRLQDRKQDGV
ncbi:diguanylate phosphodiesterase [Rhodospirillum rubrum]|uniref:putative bifunctional diguanylate cyclase/phosphodiesterase n=1 Tax=Rhodospirillum rubrum TaxID=1085 RepID=UPI001908C3E8|nr:EAL domain-containing protein [Rhodospirillum rubrum]MBK1666326.1 diguanylate phosphodiesterase [Rhodospirillum rubrum]MBK1677605.1 diguanylate phosphodiesterase [Rhodospirillum rubrum]